MTTEERLALALDKLRECAAECAECGGTGLRNQLKDPAWPHLGYNQVDCEDCADIREVIAACTAP